jgi:Rrf2 family protein
VNIASIVLIRTIDFKIRISRISDEAPPMLSQTTEYALRAVVYLARNSESPRTSQQVAAGTKVPPAYLSKVLQGLTRAGVVVSQRGLGGGFLLARPPEELTLFEVVDGVEPIRRIESCPLKLASHGANLCPLHRRLDHAIALVEEALRATTLAEMLAEPASSVPLCPFPISAAGARG